MTSRSRGIGSLPRWAPDDQKAPYTHAVGTLDDRDAFDAAAIPNQRVGSTTHNSRGTPGNQCAAPSSDARSRPPWALRAVVEFAPKRVRSGNVPFGAVCRLAERRERRDCGGRVCSDLPFEEYPRDEPGSTGRSEQSAEFKPHGILRQEECSSYHCVDDCGDAHLRAPRFGSGCSHLVPVILKSVLNESLTHQPHDRSTD